MRLILVSALLLTFCFAKAKWYELDNYRFENYVQEFQKYYSAEEYAIRERIFQTRLSEIRKHNQENHSWKKGVNHLTDRTKEEMKATFGYDKNLGAQYASNNQPTTQFSHLSTIDLPNSVDWREKNIISPIKDQGQCGSCWTFATSETVESYWAMKTGQLDTLSEQQIASCTPNPNDCGGTGGCGGGIAEIAYEQIMKLGGLSSEWTYPYVSYRGKDYSCIYSNKTTPPVAKLSGYSVLPPNQLQPVLGALATHGPLAVNVDASNWDDYESGVFNGCNMVNPDINHVVQLVGYGVDSTTSENYWLVRNSWGTTWGEDGYIRLLRNNSPVCGVDTHPQDGTGCNNGPTNVTVCGTCGILYSVSFPKISS